MNLFNLSKIRKTSYDEHYFTNPLYKTESFSQRDFGRLAFVKNYRKTGDLLEIGSAEGYFLSLLSDSFNVTGIEFSKYAADIAKNNVGENKIINGDITKIELEANKYDVVLALNILEHLDNPEQTLKKLSKSLRKGGILIGSVPNNQYLIGWLVTIIGNQLDKTHVNTYKVNKWRKLLKDTGFEKIDDLGEIVLKRGLAFFRKDIFWSFYSQNYIFVYKKS